MVENYQPGAPADHKTNVRTQYTYDANGNRRSIIDGNGHASQFTYDKLGRLATESDPLGHTWTYTYDKLGNRLSMLDANGQTTTYTYDSLNRLTSILYSLSSPSLPPVSFTYNLLDRTKSMTDSLGATTWHFDELNRPTSITDPFNQTVAYDYDKLGNRTGAGVPGHFGSHLHLRFRQPPDRPSLLSILYSSPRWPPTPTTLPAACAPPRCPMA